MQIKSIAEGSKGSILQYFRPSLSNELPIRPLFCLFLSGHFTQVLLYENVNGPITDSGKEKKRQPIVYKNETFIEKCANE